VVLVAKKQREGLVDRETQIVDCAHRKALTTGNRCDADARQAHETHSRRDRQTDDVWVDAFDALDVYHCGHTIECASHSAKKE